jgi:hypothetical protein
MIKSFFFVFSMLLFFTVTAQSTTALVGLYERKLTPIDGVEELELKEDKSFRLTLTQADKETQLEGNWSSKNKLIFLDFGNAKIEKYKTLISIEKHLGGFRLCYHSNPTATKKSKYFKRIKINP